MNPTTQTIRTEQDLTPPFFNKLPISIERGQGVRVWDEDGREFLDFTSGWRVTCLGHAHPAITDAVATQAAKIMQNPNSGATYSPRRAELLRLMQEILPPGLTRVSALCRENGALLIVDEIQTGLFRTGPAFAVFEACLETGLILNLIQGNIVRIFPALNITRQEMDQGLATIETVLTQTT